MRKNLFFAILFSLVIVRFLIPQEEKTQSSLPDLRNYLPEKTGEWKKNGPPQVYKGEDLFIYIDGGAEIYHEYGFKQVIVQDLKNKRGKSISLEIFEMTDSESAYGIYTFKSSSKGKEINVGDGAQLEDYYLNFWKSNFLVTLVGFDEEEETIMGLQRIARVVDEKIKHRGQKPLLVSFLPDNGLRTSSIKYFKGNLGLYNTYPFFSRDVFALGKGIKGDYEAGYSVFILLIKENIEKQKIFNEIRRNFRESSRYTCYMPVDEKTFRVKDNKGRSIFISAFQNTVLIAVGAIDVTSAGNIFNDIRQRIIIFDSHRNS